MDVTALAAAKAALQGPLVPRRSNGVAWLGDSLHANGSTPGIAPCTLTASYAAGATSLVVTYPYTVAAGYTNTTPPTAPYTYVLEAGTANEEHVLISAVSGSGPYTLTLQGSTTTTKAHASGVAIRPLTRQFGSQSVPMWTAILSNNRLRFDGLYAHGGYTTAQINNVFLPQILGRATLPGVVVLCTGTNDAYDLTTAFPLALSMVDALTRRGVLVVGVACPPGGQVPLGSETVNRLKWNQALQVAMQARGLPYVDVFSALVDPAIGGYRQYFAQDNTHPTDLGMRAWAQTIVSAIASHLPFYSPTLTAPVTSTQADASTFPYNAANVALLTDTNADGIPDGWARIGTAGAANTHALVSEPGALGRLFSVTRAAGDATTSAYQSPLAALQAGHKYRAVLWIKTAGMDAAWTAAYSGSGNGNLFGTSTFPGFTLKLSTAAAGHARFSLASWKADIPLSQFSFDFVNPADSGNASVVWELDLPGAVGTPAYTVEIQPWIVDLTALGVG